MNTVSFPTGRRWPALGLGTWRMGESAGSRGQEVAAVRRALELGYRVIDTAEMYGEGGAEEVVGQALAEAFRVGIVTRADVLIVSKVYPHHASRKGAQRACDASRRRLGLDTIDLYLLHWRGSHPLGETVSAFEDLLSRGRIDVWGVSNFDVADLDELARVPHGERCAANQVYYSLTQRGPGFALLPWQQVRSMPLMAYSPIDQGALVRDPALRTLAARRGATPGQLALAWLMRQPQVMAIPKAVAAEHLAENFAAAELVLTEAEVAELERRFPPSTSKQPLAMR